MGHLPVCDPLYRMLPRATFDSDMFRDFLEGAVVTGPPEEETTSVLVVRTLQRRAESAFGAEAIPAG